MCLLYSPEDEYNTMFLMLNIYLTSLTWSLPQPTITPSPPPVSQPAQAGNHSPRLPTQQTPGAPPEQSRKEGQNFKCLWQSCKRYVSVQHGQAVFTLVINGAPNCLSLSCALLIINLS